MKIKKLILDSAAFFKNIPIWEYGEEFYTVPEVISEIKDKQTKLFINGLPVQLQFRSPLPTCIKFINEFTKKTGDFNSLSLADVKVLALAYELELEVKGTSEHLKTEPNKCRTQVNVYQSSSQNLGIQDKLEGFYMPKINAKGNTSADIESITYEHVNGKCNNFESEREIYTLNEYHLIIINDYLSEFTYIGGVNITEEDFIMLTSLNKNFSIMNHISTISKQMLATFGDINIIKNLYYNFEHEKFVKMDLQDKCESYKKFIFFFIEFSNLKNLLRWFLHMQTFNNEVDFLYSSSEELSLTSIFDKLGNHRRVVIEEDHLITNVENDINNLHISESEQSVLEYLEETENEEQIQTLIEEDEGTCSNSDESDEEERTCSRSETDEGTCSDDERCSDSDDEGWITPSNIKLLKNKQSSQEIEQEPILTACMTADYAMQNTLKHIGLTVIGVDGKLIDQTRTFILRCYACYKTTNKMDLLFCKHCGNKTLKKVSVTLNPDGTQKIWISSRRPINTRGTKFSLPAPKGGKYAINPILVADQREAHRRVTKQGNIKNDPLHEDYVTKMSPFTQRDVYSRSAQLGIRTGKRLHRGLLYWEQKNPNVPLKKKGTSRRK